MNHRASMTLFAFIENRLIDYGLSPQYAGFRYLSHAILWSILDRKASLQLSVNLYPRIAKNFNVSTSAVEHGIRNLLYNAWKRNESPARRSLFAIICTPPSNARCIALLSRLIRTQYIKEILQPLQSGMQPSIGS